MRSTFVEGWARGTRRPHKRARIAFAPLGSVVCYGPFEIPQD